jgi:exonuclease VII small subunit
MLTDSQKQLFETALSALESGVLTLDAAIAEFDKKRTEYVVARDMAISQIAEARVKLGLPPRPVQ